MDEPMPADSLARFLTLADAAEVLNVSPRQALGLIRSGELPAIRIGAGGRWRIERSVLESYIDAMYEATRRMSLWHQGDDADVAEFSLQPRRG